MQDNFKCSNSSVKAVNEQAVPGIVTAAKLQDQRFKSVLASVLSVVAETPEQKQAQLDIIKQCRADTTQTLKDLEETEITPQARKDLDAMNEARLAYYVVRDKMAVFRDNN